MSAFLAVIKAVITRLVFAGHGFVAIWQVTLFKNNRFYWYLSSPILLLFFEGLFTLAIKENQEWKWFCPSVFLYLLSVIPSIWILELEKIDKRLKLKEDTFNLTESTKNNLKDLNDFIGVEIKLPEISLSTETWITVIEQFLMLILIIGRWMLPKGELTRDQLSQLLLVYIGTAADIIEFFDSFKDDKIATHPILVLLTLTIWSWSLMQFTVVLTATKSRKSRLTTASSISAKSCCGIDVWGIAINIILQDAPFLAFRLLLITHFNIISYMNIFFTCKNSLVIILQLYRLHVVYSESKKKRKKRESFELTKISIISKGDVGKIERGPRKKRMDNRQESRGRKIEDSENSLDDACERNCKNQKPKNSRKDTGYSTESSFGSNKHRNNVRKSYEDENNRSKLKNSKQRQKKLMRSDVDTKSNRKYIDFSEEESQNSQDEINYSKTKKKLTKYINSTTHSEASTD